MYVNEPSALSARAPLAGGTTGVVSTVRVLVSESLASTPGAGSTSATRCSDSCPTTTAISSGGLTVKGSNGDDSGDAQRSQTWRYPLPGGLVLNGPVVLHLTSSGSGNNVDYGYLYDCLAGGAGCVQIGHGSTTWSGSLLGLGWVSNDVSLGTVSHTLLAGHELRLRIYSGSGDQAVAMTGDFPSSLTLTVP